MTGPDAPTDCDTVAPELAELALGILSGRERVAALAHLDHCDHCRAQLEQLSLAADAVLAAAPEAEPPVGFEQRVVERMVPRPVPLGRGAGRVWTVLAVAASVVILALAGGIGLAVVSGGGAHPPSVASGPVGAHASAELVDDGHTYGRVSTYNGYRGYAGWVFMSVADTGWAGPVRCRVILTDGSSVTVGHFWLEHGSGSWGAALPVPADQVTGAQVVGPSGAVLASATLRA